MGCGGGRMTSCVAMPAKNNQVKAKKYFSYKTIFMIPKTLLASHLLKFAESQTIGT